MKIKTLLTLFALAVSPLAYAHLGETLEECGVRYGEPSMAMKDSVIYKKNGYQIGTFFVNGKVEAVTYTKESGNGFGNAKMSDPELMQILEANCPARVFSEKSGIGKRMFGTSDGYIVATYDIFKHSFTIMTKKGMEAWQIRSAKEAQSNTSGL